MIKKRKSEVSMSMIAFAIIALIVIVVVIVIFSTKTKDINDNLDTCQTRGGECMDETTCKNSMGRAIKDSSLGNFNCEAQVCCVQLEV